MNEVSLAPHQPERLTRYRWAAEACAGADVLDAGCGAGAGAVLLAERAASVVGVDISPAALADARESHGDRAEFREGDLRHLPFGDDEFDVVTCFEALTQVEKPAAALDELRRVLRPAGLLLVSAPNREVYPPGNPLELSELAPDKLEELLAERFENVAVHPQQTYFASLLCDEKTLRVEGAETEIEVRTAKLLGGPVDSALYAVAAASDSELPPPPALLALGEDAAYEAQRRELAEWQQRAIEAEAATLALERQLRDLQS